MHKFNALHVEYRYNYFVSMQIIFMFLKNTMAKSFCTQYFGKKSGSVTQVGIEVCRDDAFSVITGREFRSCPLYVPKIFSCRLMTLIPRLIAC